MHASLACTLRSLAGISLFASALSAQQADPPTLIRAVTVFDGVAFRTPQDVLIQNGRIARMGSTLAPPTGAVVVDGRGKTLLPGLIDSHTHTWAEPGRAALHFGVTTEIEMFTDVKLAASFRGTAKVTDRADLISAGTLVTAPKGHGTQMGMTIPTITSPDSAQAFVDARLAEGSDFIKVVFDDGHSYGGSMPTITRDVLAAVVRAAHERGKLAVVHVLDQASARTAIELGADGLVHLFVDENPAPDFATLVKKHGAFIIPTMIVLKSITGVAGGAELVKDPRTRADLTRMDSIMLVQPFPRRANAPVLTFASVQRTVAALNTAGVRILAGSDAGNPGTAHGVALHRELELLVEAGLTPAQALASATSVPASVFKLADRGRIRAGLRADLLLVRGDPRTDITVTRDIEAIWKHGVRLDRSLYAQQAAESRAAVTRMPAGAESGLISDFENGDTTSVFGSGWSVSNDAQAGGSSSAAIKVVVDGAQGSTRSLEVAGTISARVPYAWGGAMFTPGATMFQPVNLSSKKEIRFWAKGDGQTYRTMVFAESKGYTPLSQSFIATPEWKEHVFPFSAFGIDGRDIMAVVIAAGPAAGKFSIRIDDVRVR